MRRWTLAAVFLLVASVATAQTTVLNPTKIQFVKSPDHATITRYELRHFLVGASAPVQVQDLGKPVPDAAGLIIAPITSLPINATNQYVAKVAAIGAAGEGVSAASAETYYFVGVPGAPTSVSVKK